MVEKEWYKEKKFLIGIGVLIGVVWIFLIGWKSVNPEVNLRTPLIVTGLVLATGGVAYIGSELFKKIGSGKSDIPDPITKEGFIEIIKKEAEDRWNNIQINGIRWMRSKTVNKNQIYTARVHLELDDEAFIIVVNANYPQIPPTTFSIDSYVEDKYIMQQVFREVNNKAQTPIDEPDVEETETENPMTGVKQKVRRVTQSKKPEEKKEDNVV